MPNHYNGHRNGNSNGNNSALGRQTAGDGTELELRRRDSGDFDIVDRQSGEIVEEVRGGRGEAAAREELQRTSEFITRGAELEEQQDQRQSRGGFGGGFGGGFDAGFGGSRSQREQSRDTDTGGGFFGGFFGSNSGSSSDVGIERDATNGRFVNEDAEPTDHRTDRKRSGQFASRKREDVDITRGQDGRFRSRGDEDSGGLFDGWF